MVISEFAQFDVDDDDHNADAEAYVCVCLCARANISSSCTRPYDFNFFPFSVLLYFTPVFFCFSPLSLA